MTDPRDPALRFSDRVDAYARYRPGYPDEAVDWLLSVAALAPRARVADVGAGTGILSAMLLARGHPVDAVEPNEPMRTAAACWLGGRPGFRALEGTAEDLPLADGAVALVVAAQAFHWFDPERSRVEIRRVLAPGGSVGLLWNARRTEGSAFAQAYERLLLEHGTDYTSVRHERIGEVELRRFFGGRFLTRTFGNEQRLDRQALHGRLASSSYAPAPGQPGHTRMLAHLDALFDRTAEDGAVVMAYRTEVHVGLMH